MNSFPHYHILKIYLMKVQQYRTINNKEKFDI